MTPGLKLIAAILRELADKAEIAALEAQSVGSAIGEARSDGAMWAYAHAASLIEAQAAALDGAVVVPRVTEEELAALEWCERGIEKYAAESTGKEVRMVVKALRRYAGGF